VRVILRKETIIPDQMFLRGSQHPARWVPAGDYILMESAYEGERYFLIPDTSLGASLDWWQDIDGFGGVRLIYEENSIHGKTTVS
jgi:hypothetical protein